MPRDYALVNYTRKEWISFKGTGYSRMGELMSMRVTAALANAYLLTYCTTPCLIAYVIHEDWPFPEGSWADLKSYVDKSDEIIEYLIECDVLADDGPAYLFPNDPDPFFASLYTRQLRHIGHSPDVQW